jgi:drug/metabolite transporter (DMT)-like permease
VADRSAAAAARPAATPAGPGWSAYLLVLLTTLIWGGTNVVAKIGVGLAPAAGLAALRFGLAAFCFLALAALTERSALTVRRADLPLFALLGLTGMAASNVLFFWGLTLAPVTDAALLAPSASPLLTAIFAALLLGERYRRNQIAGMGLSLAGVVCVVGAAGLDPSGGPTRLLGDSLLLLGSASWGLYTVLGRRALQRYSPLGAVTWSTLLGCPLLLLVAAPTGWDWLWSAGPLLWASLLYLTLLGSVVALLTWSRSVRDLGAARAGQFSYLVPIWSLLLAALFLGERPVWLQIVGGLLVLAGIWLANRRPGYERR